jgi:CheY-like chemotaxis protein
VGPINQVGALSGTAPTRAIQSRSYSTLRNLTRQAGCTYVGGAMPPEFKQPTIVIIDDSIDIREVLVSIFENEGYRAIACMDADEGFAIVRRVRPDVVISDAMLGVTSGLELITRLRSDLTPPVPPIVVLSGFPNVEEEARRRGAFAFIPKPFELDSMLDAVRAALGGRTVSEEERARARRQSEGLRRDAADAARMALARLQPRMPDLERRREWTDRWYPGYLGYGRIVQVIVGDHGLEPYPSPTVDAEHVLAMHSEYVRDIIETSSAVVLPRARRHTNGSSAVGLFVGVPLRVGRVSVGAVCLVDDYPHAMDAADFFVFEELGRRSSAILGNTEAEGPAPLWEPSGLLTDEALEMLIGAELQRSQRRGTRVGLLVFESAWRGDPLPWARELEQAVTIERLAIAELGPTRYAVLLTRDDADAADEDAAYAVHRLRESGALRAGAMVSVDGFSLPPIPPHELRRLAETLLQRELRGESGEVQRIVLRHEALQPFDRSFPAP